MNGISHGYFEFDKCRSPTRIKDVESKASNTATVFCI